MVTSLYAALLAVLFLFLCVHVIRGRWRYRIALSDGDNQDMKRRIRAHANFVEYTPFFLVLLGFAEAGGLSAVMVHGLGCVFVAGRVTHAYSMIRHERYENGQITHYPYFRSVGMVCTFGCFTLLALVLLAQYMNVCCD